jgi:hypothetical protein
MIEAMISSTYQSQSVMGVWIPQTRDEVHVGIGIRGGDDGAPCGASSKIKRQAPRKSQTASFEGRARFEI